MDRRPTRCAASDAVTAGSPWRVLASVTTAIVLLLAVVVVAARTVATSSSRVAASTSSDGFLTAGTVVIGRGGDSAPLLFDADDLFPGRVVAGCVAIEYAGSVPADIRLHGERRAGTGLDEFVDLSLTLLPGGTCPTDSAVAGVSSRELFAGRMSELWAEHSTYATGIGVSPAVAPGDRLAVQAVAVVVDDDGAAGLSTDFVVTFEGRPR